MDMIKINDRNIINDKMNMTMAFRKKVSLKEKSLKQVWV